VLSPDPGSPPARIGRRDPSYQLIKPQKFLSQVETAGVVQIENLDGGAATWGQALKVRAPEREVVNPTVPPRVKQDLHATRQWVDPTQVRILV
jgi:hypothetical protein